MKEDLSEFLKVAYQYGRVKETEEAFKEFPVEEEWHKGKVENVLKENNRKYVVYQIGDIVFVKEYIYSDGKNGNNHLFVIIDQNNTAVPIENFGMLISSKLDKLRFKSNVLLEKDNTNNSHQDSIIKTAVIYKISNEQILFKIGRVDYEKIEEYKKIFFDSLKGNKS